MTPHTDDLASFIAAHAHPYDATTDTYRRAPFAQPTKAGKNTAIYNAHTYHTKVPPLGIVPYIEHYTEPGDLILDPFCGAPRGALWIMPEPTPRERRVASVSRASSVPQHC